MSTHPNPETLPAERSPGRPREPEVDQRILGAALRLMAQLGYVRMSMDGVAAEAGVTKPTIYRRYPGKAQLATAAIVAYCEHPPAACTADTRAALIAEMTNFRHGLDRPNGMVMLGTVLAEEYATPELLASFREHLVYPRRQAIHAILARAQERCELRTGADLDLAGNMLIGAYYAQYLAGEPFADDWAAHVVDAVLAGLQP
jgi:AcrR family transcriptional regulator